MVTDIMLQAAYNKAESLNLLLSYANLRKILEAADIAQRTLDNENSAADLSAKAHEWEQSYGF